MVLSSNEKLWLSVKGTFRALAGLSWQPSKSMSMGCMFSVVNGVTCLDTAEGWSSELLLPELQSWC